MKRLATKRHAMRLRAAGWLSVLLLSALAACAAPTPQAADDTSATANTDAVAQADTRPKIGQKIDLPPMSDPYPPVRVGDRNAPVQVDRSCHTDADCAVKNVGNCCGAMPACVNKTSPTDPAGVQAQCAKDGMASVCGFAEIEGCRCVDGQCISAAAPLDPSRDPPVPVR
jgi:hypothetical protein